MKRTRSQVQDDLATIPEGQVLTDEELATAKTPGRATVHWEGVEYVVRDRNMWWYVGLVVVTALLVVLSVILRWWTFTVVIVLAAIALVLYTVRPPRKIKYVLNNRGLKEGERLYAFTDFKAFGVEIKNQHYAIVMIPRKRFSPRVRVYFPEEMGEAIVDAFGARLPMEEVKEDLLDKLVQWLRI